MGMGPSFDFPPGYFEFEREASGRSLKDIGKKPSMAGQGRSSTLLSKTRRRPGFTVFQDLLDSLGTGTGITGKKTLGG